MLRRIVFNCEDGDEAWLASLSRAGFSNSDIQHVYENLCGYDWAQLFGNGGSEDTPS